MKRRTHESAVASEARAGGPPRVRGRVLIVEPDALMRWSMMAYLERWFDVLLTDTVDAAHQLLDRDAVQALIVSDELPDDGARQLEAHARRVNPAMQVVRTGTDVEDSSAHAAPHEAARRDEEALATAESRGPARRAGSGAASPRPTSHIEKPFALAELAVLLGVPAREVPLG